MSPPHVLSSAGSRVASWQEAIRTVLLPVTAAVILIRMTPISQVLSAIERGDAQAASELLPLVYHELRGLAARKLARERDEQSLQPTALVHEAYLRLVGTAGPQGWGGRAHFFAACAEAMRRILVERARRRRRLKRGGGRRRLSLDGVDPAGAAPSLDLLALDEALTHLAEEDPHKARLVELRYFAGLSLEEAAGCLGVSRATASRAWTYARAWLYERLREPLGS